MNSMEYMARLDHRLHESQKAILFKRKEPAYQNEVLVLSFMEVTSISLISLSETWFDT